VAYDGEMFGALSRSEHSGVGVFVVFGRPARVVAQPVRCLCFTESAGGV
jgi:hypothetical protein